MKLSSWAEAVVWICTRDTQKVMDLEKCDPSMQLGAAMRLYKGGTKIQLRRGLDDDDQLIFMTTGGGSDGNAQQALEGLRMAVLNGLLSVRAFGKGTATLAIVPFEDLTTSDWRLADPAAESGFWSREQGRMLWRAPMLVLSDVQNFWPAPLAGRRSKVFTLIMQALLATGGKLKKEDALALAELSDGYTRAIFEEVWQNFPRERKFGRGERGPARH